MRDFAALVGASVLHFLTPFYDGMTNVFIYLDLFQSACMAAFY
jgi:hypothetical protein